MMNQKNHMNVMNQMEENDEKTEYNHVINYLLKTINKNNTTNEISDKIVNETKPVFLYEFFVFNLYTPLEILKTLKQPVVAFRLLDFPTQVLEGKIDLNKELISFNQGKSCFFEMEDHQLKEYLQNEPLYIMFIDMNFGDMKIIASSRVNVSIFAFDHFLNHTGSSPPQPRRNILKLFDNVSTKVAEFDLSLIVRREYFKYESKSNNNVNEMLIDNKKEILIEDPDRNSLERLLKSNSLSVNPKENKGLVSKEEIVKEINNIKKEAGVNTTQKYMENEKITENKISNNKENFNLNPSSNSYVVNLKNLLEGKEKNPPPLYFHNKRIEDRKETVVIKIINEDDNKSRGSRGTTTNDNMNNNSLANQQDNMKAPDQSPIAKSEDSSNTKRTKVPLSKEVEYIKKAVNQKVNENKLKLKPSNNSYEKKMRELNRYQSSSNSSRKNDALEKSNINTENSNSKKFIEDDYENFEGNEYYNLFSKIKKADPNTVKTVASNISGNKKTAENEETQSLPKSQNLHTKNNSNKSNKENKSIKTIESNKSNTNNYNQLQKENDSIEKYDKDKFYEISNTHQFEISSNVQTSNNNLIRSYNSFSVSNSHNNLEIRSSDKFNIHSSSNKKTSSLRNVRFENKSQKDIMKTLESVYKLDSQRDFSENIEEDINVNNSNVIYVNRSGSKKKSTIGEEIIEEYNDFDYDHFEEGSGYKFNNKIANNHDKEDSEIEEDL